VATGGSRSGAAEQIGVARPCDRRSPLHQQIGRGKNQGGRTAISNARPEWLAQAHRALDAAVLAAYGWPADLPDDEILARLLALNHARAAGRQ
jgi:hypothetical protein